LRAECFAAALFCLGALGRAEAQMIFQDGFEDGTTDAWGGQIVFGSGTLQTSDGQSHTYYYRIPATPAPVAGRAVLLWLHGDGGSGNGYGAGFYPVLDPDGAMLVTPSGINQTWTHAAGDLPGMPQDSQFLSLLIDLLRADGVGGANVDPNRIYLGGESRGAYMPYYLLQRPSTREKLAAVAVNAGLLYCDDADVYCEADTWSAGLHYVPTPILHLHGTNDAAVAPPPTATFHDPVDWNVDWRVFSPMKLWAYQNGCFGGDNSTGNDSGVLQETFTVGANQANRYDLSAWGAECSKYQLILVTNGGHVIGGQHARIWAFLESYQLGP
jgi:poly(3-hydroxybutyrate) depolymerase